MPKGIVSKEMQLAMKWWVSAFEEIKPHRRSLKYKTERVDLFCDAAGDPSKIAAVLFDQGPSFFARCVVLCCTTLLVRCNKLQLPGVM